LPDQAESLQGLVDTYEQIQQLVYQNWKLFPFPHWLPQEETWSREMRGSEIKVLGQIRELEKKAVSLLGEQI